MKKKALALTLCASMVAASLAGCGGVKTRDEVKGTTAAAVSGQEQNQGAAAAAANNQPIDLQLLFYASNEDVANVLRDQLTKAGFNVKLNMQPDYSSYKTQLAAGNYDLDITGWTTVTGNPDYAVRSLFKTGGDYNNAPVEDPKVDELIEKAGTETPEEYQKTYTEFEKYLVDEMAYIVPLNGTIKTQAVNKTRMKTETVRLSKSRSMCWETMEFQDGIDPQTEPLRVSQTISTLTSMDPIKGNDGSINTLNTNMYVRLVNLTDDDQVVADGSLSYNYAIADGNQDYYFLLRDDINFGRVQDGHAVDSGVLVGAEDVVFSMERAKDKESVPNHKTYSLHENMDTITIVTDIAELENAKVSGSDETVKAALEKGTPAAISTLVETKDAVDNAAGAYQVVKIRTVNPFPQVLNYLAHQSAGIVDAEVVKSVNTYDVKTYDIQKDIAYGDQSTVTEGATYNNTLSCSGPYVMIKKNDYEVTFEANPAYRVGSEYEPHIKNVTVKFYKDSDSSLSGLRSGEIDILYSIPDNSFDLVRNSENLVLQELPSNAATYCTFNLSEGSPYRDVTLRKAVLAAINQEELLAVFNGARTPLYSTLSPLVNTGNVLTYVPGKSQELQAEYLKNKAN